MKKPHQPPARRRSDPAAKAAFRDELVAIARELFAREGFHSVSMRAIATRAGCSPMALYKYFPNKLAMLRYIWADIFTEAFGRAESAMRRAADPEGKLRAYWRSWMRYWLAHPQHYHVVFMTQDVAAGVADPTVRGMEGQFFADGELARSHLARLAEVFDSGMRAGRFAVADPEQCVRIFTTHMLGLLHAMITIPELRWNAAGDLVDAAMQVSLRGFAAPPPLHHG